MKKTRLDQLIVSKGLASSRHQARAKILAGEVFVAGVRIDKPGKEIDIESDIVLKNKNKEFVSRGGIKLAHALNFFKIDVSGKVALDVGASTGGFCDCLLKQGAKKIYAVDVGRGQIAWELRKDERIKLFEKTNIRYLKKDQIDERIDIATVDVSFISLRLVLAPIDSLMQPMGEILCLVKPQFEVGRGEVGKGGVIRDPQKHTNVLLSLSNLMQDMGFSIKGVIASPICGPAGNREFFIYLSKQEKGLSPDEVCEKILKETMIEKK